MSRYEPLNHHLARRADRRWTATFEEIERILGSSLPASAYKYPAWWANQSGSGHIQSASWQRAGWRTAKLDLERHRVDFERVDDDRRPDSAGTVSDQTSTIDERIALIRELSGMKDREAIIAAALQLFAERVAAQQLAALGGTMPDLEAPPRRRFL